jgi:hypothetical protein
LIEKDVSVQHAPQAEAASLAAKTRLRLKHSPLRSTAPSCGVWGARLNNYHRQKARKIYRKGAKDKERRKGKAKC